MKTFACIALCFFYGISLTYGSETQVQKLREMDLWNLAAALSPEQLRLSNKLLENEVATQEFENQYVPETFGMAMYRRTNEEPFIAFNPIISPQSVFEGGIQKKFRAGISANAAIGLDNRTFAFNGNQQNPSIATARVGFNIDLWKNFLGKFDRETLKSIQANKEYAEVYRKIGQHRYWISLRSIFWNLITLDQQIELAQTMLQHAKQQEKEVQRRYRDQAADLAELSLYQSQSASRQSEVLHLEFQREQYVKQLASMLPQFSSKKIQIISEDPEQVRAKVLHCIANVQSYENLPSQATHYDELLEAVSQNKKAQIKLAQNYGSVDVNLAGNVFSTAVDPEIAPAFGEVFGEKRQGFQVQLNVSVPLGKGDTKKKKTLLAEQELQRERQEIQLMMQSSFDFIQKSIPLLLTSIESQKKNIDSLQVRTREGRKKYNQGRISLSDYISDQDRLLQSELNLKSSQNMVIQTLLQYLEIFDQTQCTFNQVKS
ncbi:MAG: TolC family protein [Bdellovibrionales bacterium]|nr:TolC family protein [Bdellovibrionales bacterium]